jgi:hypothetical protein
VHWYNRDKADTEEERREEIRKIKEAEEDALSMALYVLTALNITFLYSPSSFITEVSLQKNVPKMVRQAPTLLQ